MCVCAACELRATTNNARHCLPPGFLVHSTRVPAASCVSVEFFFIRCQLSYATAIRHSAQKPLQPSAKCCAKCISRRTLQEFLRNITYAQSKSPIGNKNSLSAARFSCTNPFAGVPRVCTRYMCARGIRMQIRPCRRRRDTAGGWHRCCVR